MRKIGLLIFFVSFSAWSVEKKWTGLVDNKWGRRLNWNPIGIPKLTDDVIIPSGSRPGPIINVNANCQSLTIENGKTVYLSVAGCTLRCDGNVLIKSGGAISFTANAEFWVTGTWVDSGTFTHTAGWVIFTGNNSVCHKETFYRLAIWRFGSYTTPTLTLASGETIKVKNRFLIDTVGTFNGGNGSVFITYSWDNRGTFNCQTGCIVLKTTFVPVETYYDLVIDTNTTLQGDITVKHNLKIKPGRTLNAGSYTIYIGGDFINEGTFNGGTGKVVFNGTSDQIVKMNSGHFNDVEINKSSGKVIAQSSLDINGDFTIVLGEFSPGNYTHTVAGNWSDAGGVFQPTSGRIKFDGTSQTITTSSSNNFYELEFAGGVIQALSSIRVTKQLILTSGTFDPGNFTHYIAGDWDDRLVTFQPTSGEIVLNGDTITIKTGSSNNFYNLTLNCDTATILSDITINNDFEINGKVCGDIYTIKVGGDWQENSGFFKSQGSVIFTGNKTLSKVKTQTSSYFYILKIEINKDDTLQFLTGIRVNNRMVMDSGVILPGAGTHYIWGDWIDTGVVFCANQGEVVLKGPSAVIWCATNNKFNNLKLDLTSAVCSSDVYLNGNFILQSGSFDLNGHTITVAGDWYDAGGTFQDTEGCVKLIDDALTITTGANNYFNDLIINSDAKIVAQTDIDVRGNLKIESGGLYLNSGLTHKVQGIISINDSFDLGVSKLIAGDSVKILQNGIMIMMNNCILEVLKGIYNRGKIEISGSTPVITSDTNSYFAFRNYGTIYITHLNIFGLDSEGIYIDSTATILDIANVTFDGTDTLGHPSYCLQIHRNADYTDEFTGLFFNSNCTDTNKIRNIMADGHGNAIYLIISDYGGTIGGEDYDKDPAIGYIYWRFKKVWIGKKDSLWSNPWNWDPYGVPADTEDVVIPYLGKPDTFYPVLDMDDTIAALWIKAGARMRVDTTGEYLLVINGNLRCEGQFDPGKGTIEFAGIASQIAMGKMGSFYNLRINKGTGEITVSDSLIIKHNFILKSGIFNPAGFRHHVRGDWIEEGGIFKPNSGTIIFDGEAGQAIHQKSGNYFHNIEVNKSGVLTLKTDVLVMGDVKVKSGYLNPDTFDIEIKGDWDSRGGYFQTSGGVVKFTGIVQKINADNNDYFNDITINVVDTVYALDSLTIKGDLRITGGVFAQGSFNHKVGGDFYCIGGIFKPSDGKITLTDSSNIYMDDDWFNDLVITGKAYAKSDIQINKDLDINGEFVPGNYTHTVYGNWDDADGIFRASAGKIILVGSGKTVKQGAGNYFNSLTISGDITAITGINVRGDLLITGTFTPGSYTHKVGGDFNSSGGIFNPSSGKIVFDGAYQEVKLGNTNNFYTIEIRSTDSLLALDSLKILGDVIISGKFVPGAYTHRVEGNWIDTAGIFRATSGKIILEGQKQRIYCAPGNYFYKLVLSGDSVWAQTPIHVKSNFALLSGTFIPGSYQHVVEGGWSDTGGVFKPISGTIVLKGGEVYQGSGNNFYNLTIETGDAVTFKTDVRINGTLLINSGTLDLLNGSHFVQGSPGVYGTLKMGQSTLEIGGALYIYSGGVLEMTDACTLKVGSGVNILSGGKLYATTEDAIITARNISSPYYFDVHGELDIVGLTVEYLDEDGICIYSDGVLTNFSNVNLLNQRGTSTRRYIQVLKSSNYNFTFTSVFFDDSCDTNVYCPGDATVELIFCAADGPKAGEDYDEEPNADCIKWTNADVWVGRLRHRALGYYSPNWSNTPTGWWWTGTNWSFDRPPEDTEIALIPVVSTGNYPRLDINDTCNALIIQNGASMFMNYGNHDLHVKGKGAKVEIHGELTITVGTLFVGGDWINTGKLSHYGGWVVFDSVGKIQGFTTFKNLAILGPDGDVTINAGDTVEVTNKFKIEANAVFNGGDGGVLRTASWQNAGTFNRQTGTVELIAPMYVPNETFYNLVIGSDDTLQTNLTVENNLIIKPGCKLYAKGYTIYVGGNFMNYGEFIPEGGKLVFNGSGTQYFYPGNSQYADVIINKASGEVIDTLSGADINGDFIIVKGKFSPRNFTIYVSGDWIDTGGIFYGEQSNIVLDGAKQRILTRNGNYFYKLTIQSTDTVKWETPIDVNCQLVLNSGIVDPRNYTHTIAGDWDDVNVTFKPTAGKIILDGDKITISSANTNNFYNLEINVLDTATLLTSINVHNDFIIKNGVVEPQTYTIFVGGDWNDTGGVFKPTSGRVEFNGDSARIYTSSSNNFYDLTINVTDTVFAMGALDINGDFVIKKGVFKSGGFTHTVAGNWNDTAGIFISQQSEIIFDGVESHIYSDTVNNSFAYLTISSGDVYGETPLIVKEDFEVSGGEFITKAFTYKIGGDVIIAGIMRDTLSCFYLYSNNGSVLSIGAGNYFNDLVINKGDTVLLLSDVTIKGDFNLLSGVFEPQSFTITCSGNWDDSGGEFKPSSGKVIFNGKTSTITQGINNRFYDVDFAPDIQDTIKANTKLVIYGDVNIKDGWFEPGNFVDTIKGNWNDQLGKFTPSGGEIVFAGDNPTIITNPNNWFNKLTINVTGIASPQTNLKVKDKLIVKEGILDLATGVHTIEDSVIVLDEIRITDAILKSLKGIKVEGNLKLSGGELHINGGFALMPSGSLQVKNDAIITHCYADSYYSFNLQGKIDINGLIFKFADTMGMYIDTLAEIIRFSNVEFDSVETGGTHLHVMRSDSFVAIFNGCKFDSTCKVNIHADGGGVYTYIKMSNYGGKGAGEALDEETNNAKVVWVVLRVWTGAQDTLWSNANNWSPAGVPVDTEDVLIPDTAQRWPTLDTNGYCYSINIESNCTLNMQSCTLFVKGDLTCDGTLKGEGTIEFNGLCNQNIIRNEITPLNIYNLVVNKGSGILNAQHQLDIDGDVIIKSGEFYPGSYIHYVAGDWIDTGGVFHATGGEIRFDGNSAKILTKAGNYFNSIRIQSPITLLSPIEVKGNIRIEDTLKPDTFTHTIWGDWNDFNGVFRPQGGKIIMKGNNVTIYTNPQNYFNDLEINVTITCEAYTSLNIKGDFILSSGEFIPGNYTHFVGGSWCDTGGIFQTFQGKIVFNGSGYIIQDASNHFWNLEINTADSIMAGSNIQVEGDFVIANGKFKPGSYTHTICGKFDASGGEFKPSSGVIYIKAGTDTIILGKGNNFYDLKIEATGVITAYDSLRIHNDFTLISGTFDAGNYTHEIWGDWNTQGGTFTPTAGKILFKGGDAQVILGAGNNFYNVEIDKTGSLTALSALRIKGDFVLKAGKFIPGNYVHEIEGDWIEIGGEFKPTESEIEFKGEKQYVNQLSGNRFYNVKILSDTLIINSDVKIWGDLEIEGLFLTNGYNVLVKGNWVDTSGIFQPTSGKVILCGVSQNIYQSNTNNFYVLEIDSQSVTTPQTDLRISDDLRIRKGKFVLQAHTCVVNDSIIIDSVFQINNGKLLSDGLISVNNKGLLQVINNCTLRVKDTILIKQGGKFSSGGTKPVIKGKDGKYFGFKVYGTIEVSALNIDSISSEGLRIFSTANILRLDNIRFTHIETNGTFLQIYRNTGYTAQYSGHYYDGTCLYNFHLDCSSADSAIVEMIAFEGAGAGESNDNETGYSRITWIEADVWTGTEDDQWSNPNNWADGTVPTSADPVIIKDATYDPTVNVDAYCKSIVVKKDATVNVSIGGADLHCGGDVTIENGGALNLTSNSKVVCGGIWTNDGTFLQTSGVVEFNGTNCITNSETYKALIISGDTLSLAAGVTVTVTDSFHIGTGAVFKGGEGAIFKTSSWINQGKFMPQTGTVILQAKMDVPEDTFYNLTIDADTIKLTKNLVILNDLQINAGRVFKANDDTIRIKGDWINNGEFIPDSSTCIFCGDQPQQISQSKFYNLIIENSYSTKKEEKDSTKQVASVTATGPLTIYGDFKILNGEFDPGSYTHIVMGDWIDTGGTFTPSAGEIVIAKDSVKIIQGQNNYFYNLKFQDADFVLSGKSVLKVQNVLTIDQNSAFIIDSLAEVKVGANLIAKGKFIAKGLMPSITSTQQGVKYPEVRLKGNVSISRLLCDGISGLILDTTSQIDTLENVWFMNMSSLSKALRVIKTSAYSDTYSGLLFDTTCYKNISANGAGIYIFCENYMGEHSGELYEEELNGAQIVWKDSAYIDLKWQHPGIRIFRKDVTSGIGHAFDGASYYSTKSGTLYAVDSLGNLLWKKKYGGYASDLICVRGDTLFFGTSAGTLYAVNRTDGDVIWRTNIGDSIISGVFEYGGVIYFGAKDGNFYAVDRGDGSVIWSFSTGGAIRAMPGYGFGFLHGGSCDDTLYKIGAGTGVEQAKYGTDGDIVNIPAFGRVAGSHYRIYFGNIKKNVYCLDSLRAQPYDLIWQDVLNAPAIKGPWYWWGKIYFADTLGNIYCYDIDGNPNPWGWAQYPLNISAKPTTKPLVYNGKIYIGTEKGLIAVSEKTGKILWKFDPGQKIESTPMLNVAQGVITFTTSGKIFRIGIGGAKWKRKNGMNPNVKVRKSM